MSDRESNLAVDVTIRDAGTAVLSLGGELDMETAPLLEGSLGDQLRDGRAHIVLDLTGLDFMDSSGLNVLIRAVHKARGAGGDVYLAAPTSAVRRILEITGVTTTIPPHVGVAEALAAVGGAR
ncbi:STAS domain-containing protein [Streptomyces sp. NPDC087908]|uniref:STAS domain-containing protein n=1 Tax=unclassified Streptomyces TaxID=2593676 RepID=UPI0011CE6C26|nr:STAS domain-containing protein [Streptomyces sp. adm13(2018)]MYS12222.1 anti-sigma factor antagonist [Streptomyces sp. SID6041]TXS09834.1 anti-sigma factor antagonist [Streptomyces sp. adm13(2018)]